MDRAVEVTGEHALVEAADERTGGTEPVDELLAHLVAGGLDLHEVDLDAVLGELLADRVCLPQREVRPPRGEFEVNATAH